MSSTTSTATVPKTGTYTVDPAHTDVSFVARHLVGTKVRGRFTDVEGSFTVADRPHMAVAGAGPGPAPLDTLPRDGELARRNGHRSPSRRVDQPACPGGRPRHRRAQGGRFGVHRAGRFPRLPGGRNRSDRRW